mmetsp:Transcript_15992/g.36611  ORF Transcript_15992/g.36611 Transcript_15992/m.36611 type:complete len:593 (-) Transcript_15992:75-1853(-)
MEERSQTLGSGRQLRRQATLVFPEPRMYGCLTANSHAALIPVPEPFPKKPVDREPLCLPAAKRYREAGFPSGSAGHDLMEAEPPSTPERPRLTRQLTPRIPWSSLLGDGSQLSQASQASEPAAGAPSSQDMDGTFALPPLRLPSSQESRPGSPTCLSRRGSFLGDIGTPERPFKMPPSQPPSIGCPSPLNVDGIEDAGAGRFDRDFENAKVIGSGSFATVYRARNRLDKQEYAIKKTKKSLPRGEARRREMLQEVQTLAAVASDSTSPYIVRYFGAWIEDERLLIQTELCDGTLKDTLVTLRQSRPHDPRFTEEELCSVLRDACMGLAVLHGKDLVHLDVKPENILVKRQLPTPSRGNSGGTRIHKIADLGLAVAALGAGCDEINEGDCRYLAKELLRGDFTEPKKADVFSLGLTCYELAANPKELPCNGEEWHQLRDGLMEEAYISQLGTSLQQLLRRMLSPIASDRPHCAEVLQDPTVSPQKLDALDSQVLSELQKKLQEEAKARLEAQVRVAEETAARERAQATAAAAQAQAAAEAARAAAAEERADRYFMELIDRTKHDMLSDSVMRSSPSASEALSRQSRVRRSFTT